MRRTGSTAVAQVKRNHKNLLKSCQIVANSTKPFDVNTTYDKGHGRIEKRTCTVFQTGDLFKRYAGSVWSGYVECVIEIERTSIIKGKESFEVSYYISTSLKMAKEFQKIVRSHWTIENVYHYVRDEALREDRSRIRKKPGIMARLRSFALNELRKMKVENISHRIYENALDFKQLAKLVGLY